MIDLGTGVALGTFFVAAGGVVIAAIYKSGKKNGNGDVSEKLCVARRQACETRFDSIDSSLAELHRKIDELR